MTTTSTPPRTNRMWLSLAPGLAWSLWGLAILLAGVAVALRAANHGVRSELLPGVLLVPGFGTVGAVVASRRPTHPIGWLFLAVGLVSAVAVVSVEYAVYTIVTAPGSLPGGVWVTWVAYWIWPVDLAAISFLVLLVPTGRLPSPRWRPIGWLLGAVWSLLILGNMFAGEGNMKGIGVASPVGLTLPFLVFLASFVVAAVALPAVALAPFLRLRQATGVERQQLKWLALVATVTVLLALLGLETLGVGPVLPPPFAEAAVILAMAGVTIGVPVAIGMAILRHRLYDIDRIINRTLVYGLLTAFLGAVYAGVVLMLGQVFGDIGAKPPSWAVAGATLAAAALFQPARRRIQTLVDRRFNRRKYNAAKTIEAYSVRLRDQLDLDTLSTELLAGWWPAHRWMSVTVVVRSIPGLPLRYGTRVARCVVLGHLSSRSPVRPRTANHGVPTSLGWLATAQASEVATIRIALVGKRTGRSLSDALRLTCQMAARQLGLFLSPFNRCASYRL